LVLSGAAAGAQPVSASSPQEFQDVLGQRVAWERPPLRIVSLSPSLTEILFAIGCDSAVVGVTRFCNYPPKTRGVARIGGVVDASLEAILMLQPDLVLATRGNPREFMESLTGLGIQVYAVETRGELEQILRTIDEVGQVTGRAGAAAKLVGDLRGRLAGVLQRTADLPAEARPRVYLGELEGAHWTAGPGSYAHALIVAAGGTNVGGSAPAAWSPLSFEEIIACDPEVYMGTFGGDASVDERSARQRARDILRSDPGWKRTALGRKPRIFMVLEDRLQRPGPRVFDVLEEFARYLHPELWGPVSGQEAGEGP
jgi:iron complex transport system substrate-binding protein